MNVYTLEQLCIRITDGKHGDCQNEADSGYFFISCKDVYEGKIDYSAARQITKKDFEDTHRRTQLEANDILITNSGTIGRMALIKEQEITYRTTFQKSVAIIKPLQKIILPQYLYYRLLSLKNQLVNDSNGAAQKNLLLSTMRAFKLSVHDDKKKQRRIAESLSVYDDLIENNQKQIKLFEEAVMRLYKEWFVYLRFPGHENTPIVDGVPEGWIPCVLHDVVEFNPTVVFDKNQKKKSVPMAALNTNLMTIDLNLISETNSNAGSKFQNHDTLLARITPCLENGKTAFVDFLGENEIAIGSTEYIVMRAKKISPYMVYCLARTDHFRKLAINSMRGADGRQRVNKDRLENMEYLLPPEDIVEASSDFMTPLFLKVSILHNQCHQLRQARDKLLPKLMSGEIEV